MFPSVEAKFIALESLKLQGTCGKGQRISYGEDAIKNSLIETCQKQMMPLKVQNYELTNASSLHTH